MSLNFPQKSMAILRATERRLGHSLLHLRSSGPHPGVQPARSHATLLHTPGGKKPPKLPLCIQSRGRTTSEHVIGLRGKGGATATGAAGAPASVPVHWRTQRQVSLDTLTHMDCQPVPQGSWQENHNAVNAQYNAILAASIVFFVVSFILAYKADCFFVHDIPARTRGILDVDRISGANNPEPVFFRPPAPAVIEEEEEVAEEGGEGAEA